MEITRTWRDIVLRDLGILILLALARILLYTLTNNQYGWHRDELAMLDNARHLDWGYVDYPPLAPFIARAVLELFEPSLIGVRLFSALAQSVAMVLTGLMARELGGNRLAQIVAAPVREMGLEAMQMLQSLKWTPKIRQKNRQKIDKIMPCKTLYRKTIWTSTTMNVLTNHWTTVHQPRCIMWLAKSNLNMYHAFWSTIEVIGCKTSSSFLKNFQPITYNHVKVQDTLINSERESLS